MKKTLLMAGVACLFAVNANAVELNPYVSAKLSYSDMSVSGKDLGVKVLIRKIWTIIMFGAAKLQPVFLPN